MDNITDDAQLVQQATQMTATNLRKLIADAPSRDSVSHVSLPEREELIDLISQILPAGNVVGFIFNGLAHVKGRKVPSSEGRTYINSLFKGLAIVRNNAFYRMMFAGPATVLAGFTLLLRLAGANPEDYLPEGAWQFYVEFGLREDAGRHSTETLGFQTALKQSRPTPAESEQLTAWVLASMWLLRDYHHLLSDIWEENLRLKVIEETTGLSRLHPAWDKIRPFSVPTSLATNVSIPVYRRQRFEEFCQRQLAEVGPEQKRSFDQVWNSPEHQAYRERALAAYLKQLSLHTYLEPGEYSEQRTPIRGSELHVGIIYQGGYYLLPFTDPTTPTAPVILHKQVETILKNKNGGGQADQILVAAPRTSHHDYRKLLGRDQLHALQSLQKAPILINWDQVDGNQPLSYIRGGRRGIGDHAMTIFRTSFSSVFDFSHIFFDGPWAMAVAEMVTNQATFYLQQGTARVNSAIQIPPPLALDLTVSPKLARVAQKLTPAINRISAEAATNLAPITELRRHLLRRTKPSTYLTVNDLLVLHRSIFNQRYHPGPRLVKVLADLNKKPETKILARAVEEMLAALKTTNPSLLIPIDASRNNPKDRLFASTFRSPFAELLPQHEEVVRLRHLVRGRSGHKEETLQRFNFARGNYMREIWAFGEIMRRYRHIALQGESMSTTAIRLIAGLPGAMQRLADDLPGHFSFINEAIKGEEVFSNVGQVTPGSSISRFLSAKDDNDKKVLVWGIMTDNNNRLCVTLRDFRPPVVALAQAGYEATAQAITQDFLDAFVEDLNRFVTELQTILVGLPDQ